MATDLKTEVSIAFRVTERETGLAAGAASASQLIHELSQIATYANGTAVSTMDIVHSATVSVVNGAPATVDVRGGLTSVLTGDAIAFVEITWLAIKNNSTTSGEYITIGAGSNPVVALWGATGDAGVLGPGGIMVLSSPIDGFATIAATGDVLTITAATGTISVSYLCVGRSA